MSLTISRAFALAIIWSVATVTPGGRQEPTFKGANRTVAVYATVTGADGRLVPDLTREARDEGLPKIASATGGGYFELISTSDLASTFARVADQLHHQYALGFAPAALDGRMHALEVHVAGAGMTARARKRYLARVER